MKSLFLTIAMLVSFSSFAETLTLSDMLGTTYFNPDLTPEGIEMTLDINQNGTVQFVRRKGSETVWNLEGDRSEITIVEDVFIIPLLSDDETEKYKFVVSGWSSSAGLMLYGNMFIYKDGRQITGVPITLYRASSS